MILTSSSQGSLSRITLLGWSFGIILFKDIPNIDFMHDDKVIDQIQSKARSRAKSKLQVDGKLEVLAAYEGLEIDV